jgi:hypothetical protein
MMESEVGSSNFDSADIRTARQRKEWRRVARGAAILTVQIFRSGRQRRNGGEW